MMKSRLSHSVEAHSLSGVSYTRKARKAYRRLTFMMLDADIVAVSPASVWRVLSRAGLLRKWNGKPSKKGTGFEQPPQPHQHWHIDISYRDGLHPVFRWLAFRTSRTPKAFRY
jgi:hypothetical protein